MSNIQDYMLRVGAQARAASRDMARASTSVKNATLHHLADLIEQATPTLKQ